LELVGQTPLEDAEADPMPEMLKPVSWPDVRRFFEREAQALLQQ
jgi:hypothetical protein